MTMKRIGLCAIAMTLVGTFAVPAQAGQFILGGSVGQGSLEIPSSGGSRFDLDSTGWKLFAGWRFGKYLGIEGGYTELGSLNATMQGTSVDAEVKLSGAIAQFGRTGLVTEMSKRLIGEFVECLELKLAAETAEEAAEIKASEVKGFSLFVSSLVSWIGRLFKRLAGRGGQ